MLDLGREGWAGWFHPEFGCCVYTSTINFSAVGAVVDGVRFHLVLVFVVVCTHLFSMFTAIIIIVCAFGGGAELHSLLWASGQRYPPKPHLITSPDQPGLPYHSG